MTSIVNSSENDREHALGRVGARVTLIEYGDFECPYCGAAYPIVKAAVARLGAKLRFVFRNFPLRELHPHAELAAEAAEAAGAQHRFWEMHDKLFENQRQLTPAALLGYAAQVVADPARWADDMQRRAFASRVQADLREGIRSGVNGTPSFFINGRRHEGPYDEESLVEALETAFVSTRKAGGW